MTIYAIYENGVFRPIEAVDLPDRCTVEVEVRQMKDQNEGEAKAPALAASTRYTLSLPIDATRVSQILRRATTNTSHERRVSRHRGTARPVEQVRPVA